MSAEEELNKKWDMHDVVDEAVRGAFQYNESSKESSKRLTALETSQKFMLKEIQETKKMVQKFDEKLDSIIECKADKKEVDELKKSIEKINDKSEERNYEWLKWLVVLLVGIILVALNLQ